MVNFPEKSAAARPERDTWRDDNERGLALAADGEWSEAIEAFAAAADSLARNLPSDARSAHEPLALVLSNLAQAYFRDGRVEEAMQQAQRACALRVAIAGEDGMPVARARMDLAVMLAAAGRLEEATPLVQRAIAAIEHRVGEEDARLAIVLENAARIALASGTPANAEPLLIRLHALLDAHELSTSRADDLLARVAAVRAAQAAGPGSATTSASLMFEQEAPRTPTPPTLSAFDDDVTARIYAHASIAEYQEWEDQPLRDAVAVTDVLLRTTPSGVPIIPPAPTVVPPQLDLDAVAVEEADALLDTMDLTDVLPAPSLREPTADQLLSVERTLPVASQAGEFITAAPTPSEPVAFDLDLAFDDAATTGDATLSAMDALELAPLPEAAGEPLVTPPTVGSLAIDFAVAHGMIGDEEEGEEEMVERPPVSTPVPDALPELSFEPPAPAVVPVTQIISSGPTNNIAPIADIVQTAPVFEPAPAPTVPDTAPIPAAAPLPKSSRAADERPARRSSEERVVLPKSEPPKSNGSLIAMIAGAVVAAGGAAAFYLLR